MEEHIDLLKKHRIKVTTQRLKIISLLDKDNLHLTAEAIYGKIKQELPTISFATVYTALSYFQKKKLISSLRFLNEKAYYEMGNIAHHHFLCVNCDKIYNLYDMPCCEVLIKKQVQGHLIHAYSAFFYGICDDCRES